MNVEVDSKITDLLEIYCKKFYSAVLDDDPDFYLKYKNKFFYYYMKMKQKSIKKIWSWNELMEFNIDPDNKDMDIETTTKYSFF